MPQVVAITVHLTFARRAYELAAWYRRRGSKVILGGLHVLSCPDECTPHAASRLCSSARITSSMSNIGPLCGTSRRTSSSATFNRTSR
jgi:hypothetical protein